MSKKRRLRERKYKTRNRAQQKIGTKVSASEFINYLEELTDLSVVIYLRVSSNSQRRNLEYQGYWLKKKLEQMGINVIAIVEEVASGKDLNRPGLLKAVRLAKKHKAIIVAESTDRFIRSKNYSTTNQDITPSKEEFEELMRITKGIQLATLYDPNLSSREVRRMQSTRRQEVTGEWIGRPRKQAGRGDPKRKETLLPKAIWMLRAGGSLMNVAEILGISHTTIRNWLKEYEERTGLNFHRDYLPKIHIKHIDK